MNHNAYSITAAELAAGGFDNLPPELNSAKHLIYSSPATLDNNSPGAKGFGVKRAGLAIPGSVMLLVAPGCCGRNTALLNELGYSERFFYLLLDDTDIVTGRYLKKIPQACAELLGECKTPPSAVVICITCVDALLGTDMERVCRACTEQTDVPTIPAYMYALTREKRLPPMALVRRSVYSLLEKQKRVSTACNLLGYFSALEDGCEIYRLLRSAGIKTIGSSAFIACENLTVLQFGSGDAPAYTVLPEYLESVGNSAFSGCKSLPFGALSVPERVGFIGEDAFCGCEGITELNIPGSGMTVSKQAFRNCVNLRKAVLADGIAEIGLHLFSGCCNMEEITVPYFGLSRDDTAHLMYAFFDEDIDYDRAHPGMKLCYKYLTSGFNGTHNYHYFPEKLKKVTVTGGETVPAGFFRFAENRPGVCV